MADATQSDNKVVKPALPLKNACLDKQNVKLR